MLRFAIIFLLIALVAAILVAGRITDQQSGIDTRSVEIA